MPHRQAWCPCAATAFNWSATQSQVICHARHCPVPAQVLAGVTILFSALIPLGQAPRAHSLGQLAEQYGAKCVAQEDPSVTHVVAQSNGSAKARWAAAYGSTSSPGTGKLLAPFLSACQRRLWSAGTRQASRRPAP